MRRASQVPTLSALATPRRSGPAALSVHSQPGMSIDNSSATRGPGAEAPEERERDAAWRRGQARERERAAGIEPPRPPYSGHAPGSVAARAFAALAENVRDYAIFLMDAEGVITFWGEGARLIKWWTKDETEGGHLRMLYPAGG